MTFGVLFAFQLSQWQEQLNEKKAFDRLLERVSIENRQNLKSSKQHLKELDEELTDFSQSFAAINNQNISADSLAFTLSQHLSIPTRTYSTSNLEAALGYDNSGYREGLIPVLNELVTVERETQQFGSLRLDYFTQTMIPALGEQLDFETDKPIKTSFSADIRLKNKLIVHYGLCENIISVTSNYNKILSSFDSLAIHRGWIKK